MKNLLKNKKTLIAFLGILGIVLTTVGVTVAWFNYARNGNKENTITAGGITFHYQEESQGIVLTDAMPMTDAQGKSQSRYFDFRITANINNYVVIPYTITAKVDSNSTLPIDYVKVYLTDQDNNEIEPVSVLGELDQYSHSSISITGTEKILHEGRIIQDGKHDELYRLRMWVADSINMNADNSGSGTYNNANFKIKINVYSEGKITDGTVPIQIHVGNSTSSINKKLGEQLGNIDTASLPEGVKVEGWYSDPTFTNEVTSSTIVSLSLTDLYAKYVNDYLRYSIRTDGGANTPTDITKYYSPYGYNTGYINTGAANRQTNTITSTYVSSSTTWGCGYGVAMPMELVAGQKYIYKNSGTNFTETNVQNNTGSVYITFHDQSNSFISYQNVVNNTIFTVPTGAKYTIFLLVPNDLNCNQSSTAIVYNPIITDAESHNVTLHLNGGTADSTEFIVYNNIAIGSFPSVFNDNYEIDGWYSDTNFEHQVTEDTIVTSDLTDLYIKWSNSRGYSLTNSVKTATISQSGLYKLEVWGAQGGSTSGYTGGYGGYSVGYATLSAGDILYVVVGGTNSTSVLNGGYNGGGGPTSQSGGYVSAGGGGATHIANELYGTGLLYEYESNQSNLLIVAGGGGGSAGGGNTSLSVTGNGGHGGGAIGGTGTAASTSADRAPGTGGTQLLGGTSASTSYSTFTAPTFGKGCGANSSYASYMRTSGGGGYYGGGCGLHSGGGGGSGYIGGVTSNGTSLKHMYCYNCGESTNSETFTISNGTSSCHNSEAIADCAKEGNGYVRITYLGTN